MIHPLNLSLPLNKKNKSKRRIKFNIVKNKKTRTPEAEHTRSL